MTAVRKEKYKYGDKIGRITFLRYDDIEAQKARFMCFCGTEFTSRYYSLEKGHTKSCGCIRRQVTGTRSRVILSAETMLAIEADIKENIMTLKAMAEKHNTSPSRVNSLKTKYYARL